MSHGRRAAGELRRFARANNLNFLWTLTYREAAASVQQVKQDVVRFFAGLAVNFDVLAACAVIERGGRGTRRLHVHMAMRGGVDHAEMAWLWGHGYVYFGDPARYPGRSSPDQLARYLAKYLSKTMDAGAAADPDRELGAHRWQHTQGFMPDSTRRTFDRPEDAEAWLALLMVRPGRALSFGKAGEDYAFGRFYSWPLELCWPGPSP